ncbi:hypothetical protein BC629DRAFT_575894 [Irpex lacteus]|nr:hypothetical protein BC629DRAFT_575894 [Irpex lacteus]
MLRRYLRSIIFESQLQFKRLRPSPVITIHLLRPPLTRIRTMHLLFSRSVGVASYIGAGYETNYAYIAGAALCVYEYLLTFSRERRLIWDREKSSASVLFLVNRYANIGYNTFIMLQLVPWSTPQSCIVISRLSTVSVTTIYFTLSTFAAIRTYAICNRSRGVFISVLALGLIYPLLQICYNVKMVAHKSNYPALGCTSAIAERPNANIEADKVMFFIGIGSSVAFEVLVLVLTWAKTAYTVDQLRRTNIGINGTFSYVIICNGTLHFAVLLTLHIVGLFRFLWPPILPIMVLGYSLTSILVSRFILNLREDYVGKGLGDDTALHILDVSISRYNTQECDSISTVN